MRRAIALCLIVTGLVLSSLEYRLYEDMSFSIAGCLPSGPCTE